MKADLIVKGTIYNGINDEPTTGLLAVKDGKYCYLGTEEMQKELQDEHTIIISLKDEIVLPGLFEGHAHVTSGIELSRGVNLYGLQTPKNYLKVISDYIKEHPEQKFIIGRGFQNGDFGTEGPTSVLLDEICRDKYIIIDSEDGHSCWVNSKVLEEACIDENTADQLNGVIVRYQSTGKPTGWLKEKEMDRVKKLLPGYEIDDYKEAILNYQEMALAHGIIGCFEPITNDKKDMEVRIRAYHELDEDNKLIIQFRASITMDPTDDIDITLDKLLKYREKSGGSHFELLGIKVFIDGVLEGHTAFLREPYEDTPDDRGCNMWQQDKLNSLLTKAGVYGIPVHVHAIGDAAVDSALDAFEMAYGLTGNKDLRNCITHLQILGEDQFIRFYKLGIIAVTNPFWHYKNPSYYDSLEVPYLGRKRADRQYPLKSFYNYGITVTQASDWPVSYSFYPFIGMETAVTRREIGNTMMEPLNEAEAVTVGQMLTAITINGAYQLGMERVRGSIEEGKSADFIIVDRNIFTIPKEQLAKIRVLKFFINGEEV